MKGYLLDTDICVFFLRGKYELQKKVKQVGMDNCFISEITIGELFYGAEYSDDVSKHTTQVEAFERKVQILPIFEVLRLYAREKARLRKAGTLIAEFDLLIGVTAVHHQLTMVTNNEKHFNRIDGIQIENWTKTKFNEFL